MLLLVKPIVRNTQLDKSRVNPYIVLFVLYMGLSVIFWPPESYRLLNKQ